MIPVSVEMRQISMLTCFIMALTCSCALKRLVVAVFVIGHDEMFFQENRSTVLVPCTNQYVSCVLKVLKVCILADSVSVLWLYLIGELQRDSDCWNTSGIFPLDSANPDYKRFSSYELGFCSPIIFFTLESHYRNNTLSVDSRFDWLPRTSLAMSKWGLYYAMLILANDGLFLFLLTTESKTVVRHLHTTFRDTAWVAR